MWFQGVPDGSDSKEPACQGTGDVRDYSFDPWARKFPWRRKRQPTPVFPPGKSHGQRGLANYSPWDCKEPDMTGQVMCTHNVVLSRGRIQHMRREACK